MDIFSHALLPYLLGSSFRMNKKMIAAFVIGGIAPDLDLLVTWINDIIPTDHLIVHRGFTHSFFFGFFTVLVVLYLFSHNPLKAAVQRFIDLELDFSLPEIAIAYAGLVSHLSLDFLTTRGAPLFYPWIAARYSWDIYFHTEMINAVASLSILTILILKRQNGFSGTSTRFNRKAFAIFLAVFLIVGAIRIEGKETTQEFFADESMIYPDFDLFYWTVLEDEDDQYKVHEFDTLSGNEMHTTTFPSISLPSDVDGAKNAIEKAEMLSQVKLFRWRAYAVAINASFQNGSWYLEYYDPIVKTEMMYNQPVLQSAVRNYLSVQIKVDGDGARSV